MTAQTPIISRFERSQGEAVVSLRHARGAVRLEGLRQQGSAKALMLDIGRGTVPEVVFLNTSGGLTGGDRLSFRLDLGAGCRALGTTQTAERAYRAAAGVARVEVRHSVGEGSHLDWLPQETILFDRSALERRTVIELAAGASCLLLEAVVLGRAAMGETLQDIAFRDWREVRREGRPVLVEPLALGGAGLRAGVAVLQGARAFASVALVAQGAEDALARVRAVLDEPGVAGAASGFDGKLTVRLMAADGWPLRRQVMRLMLAMRQAPLPRVWQM